MGKDFRYAIEEMQEFMVRWKEMYEATHPGRTFGEFIKSEKEQQLQAEFIDCCIKTETLSIAELFGTLRAYYDALLVSDGTPTASCIASIQAFVHALIARQQIDKLRKEYAHNKTFLAYIDQAVEDFSASMRVLDELAQIKKLN